MLNDGKKLPLIVKANGTCLVVYFSYIRGCVDKTLKTFFAEEGTVRGKSNHPTESGRAINPFKWLMVCYFLDGAGIQSTTVTQ